MKELLGELKHNSEVNKQKGLENKVDLDYIIYRIEGINVWFEVARNEVETSIDDIANLIEFDKYYSDEDKKKLDTLTDEDINRIAWEVYDADAWQDVYEYAKEEVMEELELK